MESFHVANDREEEEGNRVPPVDATPYYECLSMRDKRTHRNYARNSLNLTFLLRYTGPACSCEVTNFIGKRPIYRSPRSHTISAPPRARRVYIRRMRLRLHSDSVHTDSNRRFRRIPELPPPRCLFSTIDDGSFPTDLRYRTLSPPAPWK